MKICLYLVPALFVLLVSCVNSASSLVHDSSGNPIVVVIPGVKPGNKAPASKVMALQETLAEKQGGKDAVRRYFPGCDPEKDQAEFILVGLFGDFTLKSGRRFVGYAPMVVVRSALPQEQVDRAVQGVAKDVYQSAKSKYELHPLNQLVKLRD